MELQRVISQELQVIKEAPALTVSKGPRSGDEDLFIQAALHTQKIKDCTDEQIKQVMRYVMIKVGLRAANWPVPEETIVLLDHIRKNYGTHGLEELRLAFDMAIMGKLNLKDEQVISFENFTCTYLSQIMGAYRGWAGEAYQQLVTNQPIEDKTKLLMGAINWRGEIQAAYETMHYEKPYRFYAPQMYDQAVQDEMLHPDLYQEYLKHAKTEICSEIQQQLSPLITGGRDDDQAKIDRLQRQLNEYRAGTRDQEIITRAKQVSVWILLQEARRRKLPAIYERVDAPVSLEADD